MPSPPRGPPDWHIRKRRSFTILNTATRYQNSVYLGKDAPSPPREPPDWNGAAAAFMPPDSKAAAARAWLTAGSTGLSSPAADSLLLSASVCGHGFAAVFSTEVQLRILWFVRVHYCNATHTNSSVDSGHLTSILSEHL